MSDSKSQLVVDLDTLETLVGELNRILHSLDGLAGTSAQIAEQVGDATAGQRQLAGRVAEFSSSWDSHRREISGNLAALAKEFQAIVDGVRKADAGLADALEGSAS